MTIFPTVGVLRIVKLLFLYNFRTDGLNMGNAGQEIDGYSFSGGLLIVLADAVFFSILGCYLD